MSAVGRPGPGEMPTPRSLKAGVCKGEEGGGWRWALPADSRGDDHGGCRAPTGPGSTGGGREVRATVGAGAGLHCCVEMGVPGGRLRQDRMGTDCLRKLPEGCSPADTRTSPVRP